MGEVQNVMGFPENPSQINMKTKNPSDLNQEFPDKYVTGSLDKLGFVMGFPENPSQFGARQVLLNRDGF